MGYMSICDIQRATNLFPNPSIYNIQLLEFISTVSAKLVCKNREKKKEGFLKHKEKGVTKFGCYLLLIFTCMFIVIININLSSKRNGEKKNTPLS